MTSVSLFIVKLDSFIIFLLSVIRGKILTGPVDDLPSDNRILRGIPPQFLTYQVYTIRITKIYKGSAAIRKTGGLRVYGRKRRSYSIKVYTPSKMNSCRVDFTVGKVYVITGFIGKKKLSISGCDFKKEWSQITKKQRSGFARKYRGTCKCTHSICYGDSCHKARRQKMACAFDISGGPANECRDKYQHCQPKYVGRRCSWTMNAQYRNCLKQIP